MRASIIIIAGIISAVVWLTLLAVTDFSIFSLAPGLLVMILLTGDSSGEKNHRV